MTMKKNEVMDTLRDYTRFIKREIDTLPTTPEKIGIAIDVAIELLKKRNCLTTDDRIVRLFLVEHLTDLNKWRRGVGSMEPSTPFASYIAIQKAIEVLNAAE